MICPSSSVDAALSNTCSDIPGSSFMRPWSWTFTAQRICVKFFMVRHFVVVGVWKQQHTMAGRAAYFKEAA